MLSTVTQRPGFPTRDELIARYAEKTGRDTSRLDWHQGRKATKVARPQIRDWWAGQSDED